jgi:hypothetical protein
MSPTVRLAAAISAGTTAGLDDDDFRILYEYWTHSLRDPEHRRIQAELTRTQQHTYEQTIANGMQAGVFLPVLEPGEDCAYPGGPGRRPGYGCPGRTASRDDVLDLVATLAGALLGLDRDVLLGHIGRLNSTQLGE